MTLFEALSIFTHITQPQIAFYLGEAARVLAPEGEMNATFLLFEKDEFAVIAHDAQRNALYIDYDYPAAAVYYDRSWLQDTFKQAGLAVRRIANIPDEHGHQFRLILARAAEGEPAMALPNAHETDPSPDPAARDRRRPWTRPSARGRVLGSRRGSRRGASLSCSRRRVLRRGRGGRRRGAGLSAPHA